VPRLQLAPDSRVVNVGAAKTAAAAAEAPMCFIWQVIWCQSEPHVYSASE
jgi:hypothetical protein